MLLKEIPRSILKHPDGEVHIDELANGTRRLTVRCFDESTYMPKQSCETSYPLELIELTLKVTGPAWLCDAILRDEDPQYVKDEIKINLFAYLAEADFAGKRLLDFGCGSGASTICLGELLPATETIGVELDAQLVSLAKARAQYYGLDVTFRISPSGTELPDDIGEFDFCMMSAVYEHLLPDERPIILSEIWSRLKPGGVLFINQTPHRYYPIETHSTGLPLINYLPDGLAFPLARKLSRFANMGSQTDQELLRGGIRGGTESEILSIINKSSPFRPILLEPSQGSYRDRIDLWYSRLNPQRWRRAKYLLKGTLKAIKAVSGYVLLQNLTLAIKKDTKPVEVANRKK